MSVIEPCPFCRSTDVVAATPMSPHCVCRSCGAFGPGIPTFEHDAEQAVRGLKEWNECSRRIYLAINTEMKHGFTVH